MPSQQRDMATPKIRWTKVNDSGLIPRPRHGHRAVAVQDLMIIFGGGNEGIVEELHAYNTVSNQWFCPVVKGDIPPGCAAFGLAADNTRLIFHGGMIEYGSYSDALYELQVGPYFASGDISSKWEWKKLKPKVPRFAQAPTARLGHSFTFINGKFYLFGGLCRDIDPDEEDKGSLYIKYSNEFYVLEFRGNSWFWEMPHTYGDAPSPRESHTAVGHVDSLGNPKLLIYGGMAGVRLGDICVLDLNSMTWSHIDVDGPKPLPRSLHSSSVVGDKMYVFGGWVPAEDDIGFFEQRWSCTNSLARLNLNTYKWEEIEIDCPDGCPLPRAGHCAVVVGSRIYIWSGRDGYSRAWDVQVCCKDLWYLEVGKPSLAEKVHLVKAGTKMLELSLPEVAFCDHYILQTMPYSVPVSTKTDDPVPVKRKRKLPQPETDWADDDVGPMLPPTSPLPMVPLPPSPPAKAEKPLPSISICEEPLSPLLLATPKPPFSPIYSVPPPKSLPRPPPQMVPSPMIQPPQPFMNHSRPFIQHPTMSQHQPTFIQHHSIVRSTAPSTLPSNTIQYVPVHEFARHFPNPDPNVDMRMKHPGMVISKPFNKSVPPQTSIYPSTVDLAKMTSAPAKAIPKRGTVVKVMNPSFSKLNVQPPPPPHVFSAHGQQVSPKHTIIINKPVNRQQVVVVSSAPIHRPPQTFQTIQAVARPDANFFPPPKKLKVVLGNGVNTYPVHTRLPPPATRVHVQNPTPMYKNVKLQVNGKTLTVMMPVTTASVTPVTSTHSKLVAYQTNSHQTVVTSSCQPKFTVLQEPAPLNPPKTVAAVQFDVKQPSSTGAECAYSNEHGAMEVDAGKEDAPRTVKITGDRSVIDVPPKVIRQPITSCSGAITARARTGEPIPSSSGVTTASTKSGEATDSSSKPGSSSESSSKPKQVMGLPESPGNIKISKTADGAIISWSPGSKGTPPTGYSVNLGVKADESNPNKVTFMNVYSDVHTNTKISQDVLDRATLNFPKPTIVFRVSARNELGYGPATQVRWLQDAKND